VAITSTLANYTTDVQSLVHDSSFSTWSQSDLTGYINQARSDTALDMHCVRHNTTGVQLLFNQEIYSINGAVCGANLLTGGTGYSANTVVTFTAAPAGGVTATGAAQIANGVITAILMSAWGSEYQATPTITITDTGGGTGATATAVTFLNTFQIVNISNIWNNERYTLNFRGFTLFQAYCRAWTTMFTSRPWIWTLHPQDLNVYLRPIPDQLYYSEWDVISLPIPLVNLTDVDTQVIPPWNQAVKFRAAALALMKKQNFGQAEYYDKKYQERVPRYIMGAGGIRIPNPYNRSFQRKMAR
jgi:hypothetical protein